MKQQYIFLCQTTLSGMMRSSLMQANAIALPPVETKELTVIKFFNPLFTPTTAWASALGYTLFNISKSLEKFLSKPVSTKISIYHNEDGTMQFPTISLCNLNRVRGQQVGLQKFHAIIKSEKVIKFCLIFNFYFNKSFSLHCVYL